MAKSFLKHYGVLGMKWGVRRYQDYSGRRIERGTKVTRLAYDKTDKTYANKKHVSLNDKDAKAWESYLGEAYKKRGADPYIVEYETTKDLKVATSEEIGKIYVEKFLYDPKNSEVAVHDLEVAYTRLAENGMKFSDEYFTNPDLMATVNVAQQTETGRKFCEELLRSGYDALEDTHGKNNAEDPIIILDPDKNLKRKSDKKY